MPRRKRFWISLLAALVLNALCVAWLGGSAPRQAVAPPAPAKVAILPHSVPVQSYLPPIATTPAGTPAVGKSGQASAKRLPSAKSASTTAAPVRPVKTAPRGQKPKPSPPAHKLTAKVAHKDAEATKPPGRGAPKASSQKVAQTPKPPGKSAGQDHPLAPSSGGTGKEPIPARSGSPPFPAREGLGKMPKREANGAANKTTLPGPQGNPVPGKEHGSVPGKEPGQGNAKQPVVDPFYESRPLINPSDDVNHFNGHVPQPPPHQEPPPGLRPGALPPKPMASVQRASLDRLIGSVSGRGTVPVGSPNPAPAKAPEFVGDGTGLLGAYYEGVDFRKLLFKRPEHTIEYDWTGASPDPRLPPGKAFSVMWHGSLIPRYSETYTLYTASDDGARVWIDGKLVIDDWSIHSAAEDSAVLPLEAGRAYDLRVEYFEKNGSSGEVIKLYWQSAHQAREFVPESQLRFPKDDAAVSAPPAAATR